MRYENQYLYTYKAELNRVVAPNTELISGNDYQYIQEGELELRNGEVRRNQPVKIADTGDYINLDMDNREPMKLPASGIVLSERTAKVLGINIGGTVEWRFALIVLAALMIGIDYAVGDFLNEPVEQTMLLVKPTVAGGGALLLVIARLLRRSMRPEQ
ncbi:hypothetical protein BSK56_10390 [Paenibacillus borealis]|uniref:Uncharacterized protein n=1 Tax=Paenibacillus borealis TaxID=160799 RepID=A0ABX3HHE0_PAEBO|nr:hypothetical protein BSK56_10390 [Paenibacillus borealis]